MLSTKEINNRIRRCHALLNLNIPEEARTKIYMAMSKLTWLSIQGRRIEEEESFSNVFLFSPIKEGNDDETAVMLAA